VHFSCRQDATRERKERGSVEIPSVTPDAGDARLYARTTFSWGLATLGMWYAVFMKSGGLALLPVAVLALFMAIREALAYVKTRRAAEVRR
jgi:hypothetical protein